MIYAKTAKEVEAKRKVPAQVAPLLQSRRPTAWKKRDRALLASGQITLRKVDGWQSLHLAPAEQGIYLAA
jgi:hypothetical protein